MFQGVLELFTGYLVIFRLFWVAFLFISKNCEVRRALISIHKNIRLGLSTTLTSEDKNGDFETSLKVKDKDCILVYDGLGAKIQNISTNEVIFCINRYSAS